MTPRTQSGFLLIQNKPMQSRLSIPQRRWREALIGFHLARLPACFGKACRPPGLCVHTRAGSCRRESEPNSARFSCEIWKWFGLVSFEIVYVGWLFCTGRLDTHLLLNVGLIKDAYLRNGSRQQCNVIHTLESSLERGFLPATSTMSPGTMSLALMRCTLFRSCRYTLPISGSYSLRASMAFSAFRSWARQTEQIRIRCKKKKFNAMLLFLHPFGHNYRYLYCSTI